MGSYNKSVKDFKRRKYNDASIYVDAVNLAKICMDINKNLPKTYKVIYGEKLLGKLCDFTIEFPKVFNNNDLNEKENGILRLKNMFDEVKYLSKYAIDINLSEFKKLSNAYCHCGVLDKQLDGWLNKVIEMKK